MNCGQILSIFDYKQIEFVKFVLVEKYIITFKSKKLNAKTNGKIILFFLLLFLNDMENGGKEQIKLNKIKNLMLYFDNCRRIVAVGNQFKGIFYLN